MKLLDAKLQTLVWSADIERSRNFYSNVLELPCVGQNHGALIYRVGAGELRVSPVPSTSPSEHTVFGFEVEEVEATAAELSAKGVDFERFPGFSHGVNGVWTAPDGAKVAWFRDPDGNLISLVRYASQTSSTSRP
jgi:catechol 2,3-dioxygenase-like lactoylglutathione lyase family enzyme